MLKIYIHNKLNNSAYLSIPLLYLQKFTVNLGLAYSNNYLTCRLSDSLHSLLSASSTVLYRLTSMLQAGLPLLWFLPGFWGGRFSSYSTVDFQALSRVLILHFWFTKPSPKWRLGNLSVRSEGKKTIDHKGGSVRGTWIHLLKLIYLRLRKSEFFDQKELKQPHR